MPMPMVLHPQIQILKHFWLSYSIIRYLFELSTVFVTTGVAETTIVDNQVGGAILHVFAFKYYASHSLL